mgnify:FL=1
MQLKRKITKDIKEWMESKERKCLIISGAKGVGKTYTIEQFAKENFEEYVRINFREMPSAADIFAGDLTVEHMLMLMKFRFPEKEFIPRKTLFFLDEIQECPEAITSLKFWALDNRFDIIASGSLLGVDYKRPSSYPVGYVDYLKMHGLDFEEFLWGMGENKTEVKNLYRYLEVESEIPEFFSEKIMSYYLEYIAVGGMPEVVSKYIETRNISEADHIQKKLLKQYFQDISYYGKREKKERIKNCYLSILEQLLNKNEMEWEGKRKDFCFEIDWLIKADMIHISRRITKKKYDLDEYTMDDSFRTYVSDLSLLMAMTDVSLKQQIINDMLQGEIKDIIYEYATADALYKKGYNLYFYGDDDTGKEKQIVIQKNGKIVSIEIKEGLMKKAGNKQTLGIPIYMISFV